MTEPDPSGGREPGAKDPRRPTSTEESTDSIPDSTHSTPAHRGDCGDDRTESISSDVVRPEREGESGAGRSPILPKGIGPYPLLGELGEGGMGVVYLARDPRLEREIALKTLPARTAGSLVSLQRLAREAKLLASLNHPNIATIYSLEEAEGICFLTMERVLGETLGQRLISGPLPLESTLACCRQVAAALEAAHRQGVVHRDLKPGNIMVTPDGLTKVLDFGLAEVAAPTDAGTEDAEQDHPATTPGAPSPLEHRPSEGEADLRGERASRRRIQGTPGYMSPEQIRGEAVDPRTDVWSFGCVLYECLVGSPAFHGRTPSERIAASLAAKPDLDRLPADLPSGVRTLLSHCLLAGRTSRLESIARARQVIDDEIARRSLLETVARPLGPSTRIPNNIPLPLTSLIGRDPEVAEVKRLVMGNRLLTLTGFGGVGKTRLAMEVARELLPAFPHGVWVVELADHADPTTTVQRISQILGIRETRSVPPIEALVDHLREKLLLLVLDNCEQILAACSEAVSTIMRAAPGVRILATSREGLSAEGERVYPVRPLAVPPEIPPRDPERLGAFASVRLFTTRAQALQPEFAVTAENTDAVSRICRRLDGIPLAIELAATRVKGLPVEEIARRLDDRFRLLIGGNRSSLPHHQTLRALVDWSFDQLGAPEQVVFRRLSIFLGGWSIETAEAVCAGAGIESWDVLDLLSRLVEKSLVEIDHERSRHCEQARYRMLETVREYAREKLEAAGEGALILWRHREAHLAFVEEAERHLTGAGQQKWFARLDADYGNLLLSADACREDESDAGLRLAGALGRYWDLRGYWSEGREHLAEFLSTPGAAPQTAARAKALSWAGVLANNQGDAVQAVALLTESLGIHRAIGDRAGVGDSLHALGNIAYTIDDFARARALHEESLEIHRVTGDRLKIARSLNNLGNVAMKLGDLDQAQANYEESLLIKRELGDPRGIAASLSNLGNIAEQRRDFQGAEQYYMESLSILREIGDRSGVARTHYNLGQLAMKQGDLEGGSNHLRESLGIRRELKDRAGTALCLNNLGVVALQLGDYPAAATAFSEGLALWDELGSRSGRATCLNNLGNAAQEQGKLAEATARFTESLSIRREMEDAAGEALCLLNIGSLALREGRPIDARPSLAQSLSLRRGLEDWIGVASCLETFGEVAEGEGASITAVRLLGAAEQIRLRLGAPLAPRAREDIDRTLARLRASLGEEAFAREKTAGGALSREEAIALALA
jgi:predicted ATPase/serine/threonine protein kinase/Tfp pilus assembly protein PilF